MHPRFPKSLSFNRSILWSDQVCSFRLRKQPPSPKTKWNRWPRGISVWGKKRCCLSVKCIGTGWFYMWQLPCSACKKLPPIPQGRLWESVAPLPKGAQIREKLLVFREKDECVFRLPWNLLSVGFPERGLCFCSGFGAWGTNSFWWFCSLTPLLPIWNC